MSCTVTEVVTEVVTEDSSDSSDSEAEQPRQKKTRFCEPDPPAGVVRGRVYVASMNMRGAWAPRPEGATTVNVTSAQAKAGAYRLDFSPMSLPGFDEEKKYHCFENAWQSLKEHEGVPFTTSQDWWQKQTKGKRRYPGGKGKRVLWARFGGEQLGYVASRKTVYVPEYHKKMRGTASFQDLRCRVEQGEDVVVMDFDGPRTPAGGVACALLTLELLRDKIEDVATPFGHGYVVAAGLAGISVADYVL